MIREQKIKIRILGKDNVLIKPDIISDREDKLDGKLYTFCTNCNKEIVQNSMGRKRKYCSNKCRHQYSYKNNNRKIYELVCEYCGKKYEALSINRKYCSHNCYIRNKYWRKEEAEGIMNKILDGEEVKNIPKWFRELLKL